MLLKTATYTGVIPKVIKRMILTRVLLQGKTMFVNQALLFKKCLLHFLFISKSVLTISNHLVLFSFDWHIMIFI